ncbi:MAG: ABC transporter permease, partial [Alphaproteobacteria bacterium HGW-Alphaproteobacteria-2]
LSIIAEAFVVVVIGGMGSVAGAFVAAALISVLNAFGVLVWPQVSLILPFLVMAAVLVVRPYGLFGSAGSAHGAPTAPEAPLRLMPARMAMALAALVAAAALVPVVDDGFILVLLIDLVIAAVFAASLHLMMGVGGMVSFGHAAYFGLGAYGAAMAVSYLGLPMLPAMALGPLAAAAGALVFGWFCVRLSGVYLAMLTLAAAQIVWGVVFQWVFFWLVLGLGAGALWLIFRVAHSPFGYVLRGGRDSAQRAEAIGLDLRLHQWLGFALAGALAGLAGVLFAFAKGSVFPEALAIPHSVDGLIMVLLGGVQSLFGPILGAGAFVLLEDWVSRLDYWRAIFGAIILAIVLLAPDGIAGGLARARAALGRAWR